MLRTKFDMILMAIHMKNLHKNLDLLETGSSLSSPKDLLTRGFLSARGSKL